MQQLKRILAAALVAIVLVFSVAGCSTPATAMTIGDYSVSTGEYLANLYNMFYQVYYNGGLYYYAYYYSSYNVWDQTFTYGDGDDAVELKTASYITQLTKDSLIRQQAVKAMMADHNITLSEEDQEEIATSLSQISESDILELGFNLANYEKMLTAYNYEESTLFYDLYSEGGEYGVSDTDLRAWFDENYLVYKIISIGLTDSEGAELEDDEVAAIEEELNGYLEMFNSGSDVDTIYAQYLADTAEESDDEDDDSTSTEDTLDYTTAVATSDSTSSDLNAAIQGIAVGKAGVITYNASDDETQPTMAFVVRYAYSPDDYDSADAYYEASSENALYYMRSDDFEEELQTYVDDLTANTTYNNRAIKMCDPQSFLSE